MRLLDLGENSRIAGGVTVSYSFDLPRDPSLENWILQQAQDTAVQEYDADVNAAWADFQQRYDQLVDELVQELMGNSGSGSGGGGSGSGTGSGSGSASGSGTGSGGGGMTYDDALAEAQYEASTMMGPDPQPTHSYDYYYQEAYQQLEQEYGDGDAGADQWVDISLDALGVQTYAPPPLPWNAPHSALPPNWQIFGAGGYHATAPVDPSVIQEMFDYLMQSAAFAQLVADITAHQGANPLVIIDDPNNLFSGSNKLATALAGTGIFGVDVDTNTGLDFDAGLEGPGVLSPAIIFAHELFHVLDQMLGNGTREQAATDFERLVADQLSRLGYNELGRLLYDDDLGTWTNTANPFSPFYNPNQMRVHGSAIDGAVNNLARSGAYHGHLTVYVEIPDNVTVTE